MRSGRGIIKVDETDRDQINFDAMVNQVVPAILDIEAPFSDTQKGFE